MSLSSFADRKYPIWWTNRNHSRNLWICAIKFSGVFSISELRSVAAIVVDRNLAIHFCPQLSSSSSCVRRPINPFINLYISTFRLALIPQYSKTKSDTHQTSQMARSVHGERWRISACRNRWKAQWIEWIYSLDYLAAQQQLHNEASIEISTRNNGNSQFKYTQQYLQRYIVFQDEFNGKCGVHIEWRSISHLHHAESVYRQRGTASQNGFLRLVDVIQLISTNVAWHWW